MGRPRSAPSEGGSNAEYRRVLEDLFHRRRFGMKPTLDVARRLLSELGDPQRRAPSIHITGSKGKGSVAAMSEAILRAHGRRTGLFTSPHLVSYRERIRVNGAPIPPEEVVNGIHRIEEVAGRLERTGAIDRPPTFFEVTTALAFDWFRRENVDALVVEVGIGGRWDATNLLASRIGVVTTLELEHVQILGPTLAAIAGEKSGIFHAGMHGIVGQLPDEGRAVLDAAAGSLGVPLWHLGEEIAVRDRHWTRAYQEFAISWPGRERFPVRLRLEGDFQATNAALALAATHRFLEMGSEGPHWSVTRSRSALARLEIPGRMERVARDPPTYFDVAHTPESARAVARSLAEVLPFAEPAESAIVFGCLRDKPAAEILEALRPLARTIVLVPVRSERGLAPSELRVVATGRFPRVVVAPSALEGYRLARAATGDGGLLLALGSDYLIGELKRGTAGVSIEEPDLSDPGRMSLPGAAG